LKYGKAERSIVKRSMVKRVLDFFRKKRRNKRLEQELEKLEAKVLEADIRLSGFALFEERLIYRMLREAQRLERKRRREVRRYVV
jgi:polyphosphate kinase 2 (PPK2 family)